MSARMRSDGFEIIAPGLGDRQPARAAVKELHAQPGFERGNVLRDHGLRNTHGAAGGRQATGGGDFREHLQPRQAV